MLFTFLLMRVLIIAAVVAAAVVLLLVVVAVARRTGRLDDAKRLASPVAKGLGTRTGVWGVVGRGVSHYLEDGKR